MSTGNDITTVWQGTYGDYVLAGADLQKGDDLQTAVLISLFSDRVANDDDVIPDNTNDPRGWCGDQFSDVPIGSRLWFLRRAKRTQQTLQDAQGYALEALQWLLTDGIVAAVDVYCQWQALSFLAMQVTIIEFNGNVRTLNYQWVWQDATS